MGGPESASAQLAQLRPREPPLGPADAWLLPAEAVGGEETEAAGCALSEGPSFKLLLQAGPMSQVRRPCDPRRLSPAAAPAPPPPAPRSS